MGACHIVVGATKTGKTTFTKQLLNKSPKDRNKIVYDVNNEYKEYYNKPFIDFIPFMDSLKPVRESIILIEEATIFLGHQNTSRQLINKLVRKRHENNYIILNFHSLRKVPRYIFELANFLTVFKTLDTSDIIEKYFSDEPEIIEIFDFIKSSDNQHINRTIKLY